MKETRNKIERIEKRGVQREKVKMNWVLRLERRRRGEAKKLMKNREWPL